MRTADVLPESLVMGVFDSFYDEDSKCPRCGVTITEDWQTKRLECLMGSWHKGDFLQYWKYENIPEEERKKKYGGRPFPLLRRTNKYLSDAPLISNGKVPVYKSCNNCNSWLQAYAKITNGKFDSIVEAEIDGKEKELVLIEAETTAQTIREEFDRRLSHLQESCKHENSRWTEKERTLGHGSGQVLVCLRCEKILETRNPKEQEAGTALGQS